MPATWSLTALSQVLTSMDNEELFGPVLHRLGFGEAVERDLLTNYKVLVLAIDETYVADTFQNAMAHSGEIQLGDAARNSWAAWTSR